MLKNILYSSVEDYKKDLAKVGVAFVGGVAVGILLSKAINGKTFDNIKNQANTFVSEVSSQTNEIMEPAQEIEIIDSDEKKEILDLKKEKEKIKVDIELEDDDE